MAKISNEEMAKLFDFDGSTTDRPALGNSNSSSHQSHARLPEHSTVSVASSEGAEHNLKAPSTITSPSMQGLASLDPLAESEANLQLFEQSTTSVVSEEGAKHDPKAVTSPSMQDLAGSDPLAESEATAECESLNFVWLISNLTCNDRLTR